MFSVHGYLTATDSNALLVSVHAKQTLILKYSSVTCQRLHIGSPLKAIIKLTGTLGIVYPMFTPQGKTTMQ